MLQIVSFLVGLRTYQHPLVKNLIYTHMNVCEPHNSIRGPHACNWTILICDL